MRDFFRLAYTACRNFCGHGVQDFLGLLSRRLGLGLCQACQTGGMCGPWQHIVYCDAKRRHFRGPSFGPIRDRPSHRVGHPKTGERRFDRRADHVDHPAPTGLFHSGEHGLGQNVVVCQVLLKGREEGIGVCLGDRPARWPPRVVHQNIDGPKGQEGLHCGLDLFRVLEIGCSEVVARPWKELQCLF